MSEIHPDGKVTPVGTTPGWRHRHKTRHLVGIRKQECRIAGELAKRHWVEGNLQTLLDSRGRPHLQEELGISHVKGDGGLTFLNVTYELAGTRVSYFAPLDHIFEHTDPVTRTLDLRKVGFREDYH